MACQQERPLRATAHNVEGDSYMCCNIDTIQCGDGSLFKYAAAERQATVNQVRPLVVGDIYCVA